MSVLSSGPLLGMLGGGDFVSGSGPLMQKAVAVWLVDNTTLTFEQIACFCGIHIVEVRGIADGEVASGILGCNPIATGEISKEELDICQANPTRMPKLVRHITKLKKGAKKRTASYTPVARRRAKPDAVLWLLNYCPELGHSQIVSLVGTTIATVRAIAADEYWNKANLHPRDPVLLRLCSREELDEAILKAEVSIAQEESYRKAMEKEIQDSNG